MQREGEVRKRLVKNEELAATWNGRAQEWKAKVRLTFEFDGWTEAVAWMKRAERGLHLERMEKWGTTPMPRDAE